MENKLRVFIVVDDPIMGNLLEVRLSEAGYDARYAETADEALAAAAASPPRVRPVIVAAGDTRIQDEEDDIPILPLPSPFTMERLEEQLAESASPIHSDTGKTRPAAAAPKGRQEEPPDETAAETPPVRGPAIVGLLDSFHQRGVTGLLEVRELPEKAAIHFQEGDIVDACYGAATGKKALCRIVRAPAGSPQFHPQPRLETEARTIRDGFGALMKDAAREAETLHRIRTTAFNTPLSVDETALDREVREHRGLNHILGLVEAERRMGRVMDRSRLTDFQTYTNLLYLLKKGVVRVRREETPGCHIVTDSSADLPEALLSDHDNLTVVPISVRLGTTTYRDGIDMAPERFYDLLKRTRSVPETIPPSPETFHPVFERVVGDADILGIFLSRRLSSTADNARIAAECYLDAYRIRRRNRTGGGTPRIGILDSRAVSLGMGLLVTLAADKAAAGAPMDEIREWVAGAIPRLRIFFAVDSLGHLHRSGRLGKGKALAGGLLGYRPILGVREGALIHLDYARGDSQIPDLLTEWVHWSLADPAVPLNVGIMHAGAPHRADRLSAALRSRLDCRHTLLSQIGTAVGAHCGPGTVGVAALPA